MALSDLIVYILVKKRLGIKGALSLDVGSVDAEGAIPITAVKYYLQELGYTRPHIFGVGDESRYYYI